MIFGPQFIHIFESSSGGGGGGLPNTLPATSGNELGNYTAYFDTTNFSSIDDYKALYVDSNTGRLWRTKGTSGNAWTSTDGGNTWSQEPFSGIPVLKYGNALNIEDLVIYDINNDGQDELVWSDYNKWLYYTSYPITTSTRTSIEIKNANGTGLGWTFKLNDNWYSIKTGTGTNGLTGLWRNVGSINNSTWTHVIDYNALQGGSFPTEISMNATRHGGVASTTGTIILNLVPGSPYDNVYFRSTDDGASWTLLGNITGGLANFDVHKIATDNNDNWVLAGRNNKYYYSTNDGASWTQATPSYNPTGATDWISRDVLYLNGKWLMIRENGNGGNNPSELISTSTPWVSSSWVLEENNFSFTFSNGFVQVERDLEAIKPAGQNLILTSRDSGYFGYYKIPIIPASQTVTPASSQAIFGNRTNSSILFQSNEHTTPAESKRLWSLGNNIIDGLFGFYPDTANLEAGTVLYADSGLTQLAYSNTGWPAETRNTYAYYIINSNASNQYLVNPASVDYWVKVDTATSTILHVYSDAQVIANTLKNNTSNIGTGGTIGPNGAFFFQNGAQAGYSTYADALNVNLSGQDNGYTIYTDAEDKYPKLGDRPYVSTSSSQTGMWGNARSWHPFLLEGTTSSGSVQYAIKMDYASYDGSSNGTTTPKSSGDLFIIEIRDSNGNSVTQIT